MYVCVCIDRNGDKDKCDKGVKIHWVSGDATFQDIEILYMQLTIIKVEVELAEELSGLVY